LPFADGFGRNLGQRTNGTNAIGRSGSTTDLQRHAHLRPLLGLAKAFFYAGSRALLVSHWPVSSDAAVALTTRMLTEYGKNPGIGRAEALRRSMMALMMEHEDPRFAHPWRTYMSAFTDISGGLPFHSCKKLHDTLPHIRAAF